MSGSVDDEIVRMRFDNNAFERAVAVTIGTLAKLKLSLQFGNAGKSLGDIENKASKFSMDGVNRAVESSASRWSVWRIAGVTALATVVNQAVHAGENMVKSLTIAPIMDGFHEYETQLNSVQTILANTGLSGKAGMAQVNGALNNLNTYSDKTIYNFSEMAKNIGTFTAAGVKLNTSVASIKGIANVAALSGSNSQQASTAMYQLSQAIANNKVGLQDWNSVVNAGMGGKVMQEALFNMGKMQGTLKDVKMNETFDEWKKSGNSFRDSLKSGWITGDVLTSTLKAFTLEAGDSYSKAQKQALAAKGFSEAQISAMEKQARTATDAATKVKTFTQLMGTLKEAVGSGWAQSFGIIFGNFNEAKTLWTGVSQSIGGLISNSAKARNKVLSDWKALNGRTMLINTIKIAFRELAAVVAPIKKAFRDIFPAKTGADLANLTARLMHFVQSLMPAPETIDRIARVFKGLFAAMDIGKMIIFGIFHVFSKLLGTMSSGSGGVLEFAARIGDLIVAFHEALLNGDIFNNLFRIIANVLTIPIRLLHIVTAAIGALFSGFHPKDGNDMTNSIDGVAGALEHAAHVTDSIGKFFDKIQGKIRPAVQYIVHAMGSIGTAIGGAFNSQTFGNILKTLQTGFLFVIMKTLKNFFKGGLGGIKIETSGGIFGQIKKTLGGVTDTMKNMQQQLKAKALLEIAAAIGIIALAVTALSMIDSKALQKALQAMAIGFGELLAAMGILTKISGSAGFIKIPLMAASLDLLAVAILLLTASVALMSRLSWSELEKGLTAVGVLLGVIAVASYPLSANSAGMIRAGIGITAIAVALNLLYFAVKGFAGMSWGAIAKGLGAVAAALLGLSVIMRAMPKGMTLQAAAIVLIAGALNLLYLAVLNFSKLSWGQMVKGLVGVGGGLAAIALAMKLMPPNMVLTAAGLILVGTALQLIAKAMATIGKMSWGAIAKGLTGLAGSLTILALAMNLMVGTLAGAAALLVVSAALRIFVPSVMALASMSWGKILKGLGALALMFGTIGLASLLLTPVIPAMLALGAALGLVGVAMLAFGAGAALLGIGLTAIAASGGAAAAVLIGTLTSLIKLLPTLATSLATALVSFLTIIGTNAPAIIAAFVKILVELLNAFPKIMPALVTAMNALIQGIITVVIQNAPKIIQAGFTLLMDFLSGIKNNIGQVTQTVIDIIVNFLNTLAQNIGRIVQAGVNLLFKFLEGVARAAGQIPGEVIKLVGIFLQALFGHFGEIVSAGAKMIWKLIEGIGSLIGNIVSKGGEMAIKFVRGIAGKFGDLVSAGASIIWKVIEGIGNVISEIGSKALEMGESIVSGILNGLGGLADAMYNKLKDMVGGVIDDVADWLGIGGPSMVFSDQIGMPIALGIAHGIANNHAVVNKSITELGSSSIVQMKKTMMGLGDAIASTDFQYQPTITPVLDLTNVQKDAGLLNSLVSGTSTISTDTSSSSASSIFLARQKALAEASSRDTVSPASETTPTVVFQQTNNSPKALSTIEIYRNTKSQLATAKEALSKS